MKVSVNAPCPCGSGHKYKKCCGFLHRGRPAPPIQLMPARYCAYAIGHVDFLMATTHPEGPVFRSNTSQWRAELLEYCRTTRFIGLQVLSVEPEDVAGQAYVTFTAHLEQLGEPMVLHERSRFRRDGSRWKYVDGVRNDTSTPV